MLRQPIRTSTENPWVAGMSCGRNVTCFPSLLSAASPLTATPKRSVRICARRSALSIALRARGHVWFGQVLHEVAQQSCDFESQLLEMFTSSVGGRPDLSLRQRPEQRIHTLNRHARCEVGNVDLVIVGVSRVDPYAVMTVDYARLPQQAVIYARHRLHIHLTLVGRSRNGHFYAESSLLILDLHVAFGGVFHGNVREY